MTIPPIYWTLLGELAVVLIGVLCAVIIVILKDRKKLREYTGYLRDVIKKLKKQLKEREEQDSQERVLALLHALVEHVRGIYQTQYDNEIPPTSEEDDKPSVEKFILIAGYQMILAELSALENSNEADVTWEKIKNELTPLIENYLNLPAQPATGDVEDNDGSQALLENANQRIENLEKFKQLYFDLQNNMSKSVKEIEVLNHQIAGLAEGSDKYADIMAIIEKNKTHYINMGQIIGMDSGQHHDSVADKMDYSDELINERKDEIKRLKSQIAQQFEEIWKLQTSMSSQSGEKVSSEQLAKGIETYERQLKDAELCIETMDMEIQTLMSEISNLKHKLEEKADVAEVGTTAQEPSEAIKEKDQMIARFAQESKELMACITGLEDSNTEQSDIIKELEEKYAKLETDYASMEAKYLESMEK